VTNIIDFKSWEQKTNFRKLSRTKNINNQIVNILLENLYKKVDIFVCEKINS